MPRKVDAPAHRSRVGQAEVLECGFEEMRHPPYYSDRAPSGYHLVRNFKMKTPPFSSDNELKSATEELLNGQSELFGFTGIEKLRDRYKLTNLALTKAVTMLKIKSMFICQACTLKLIRLKTY